MGISRAGYFIRAHQFVVFVFQNVAVPNVSPRVVCLPKPRLIHALSWATPPQRRSTGMSLILGQSTAMMFSIGTSISPIPQDVVMRQALSRGH